MADIQWLDAEVVDRDAPAPRGKPCEACGTPIEPLDKFCPACGVGNPDFHEPIAATVVPPASPPQARPGGGGSPAPPPVTPEQKHFRCETCGAEVATDPNERSYVCPFCDSTYVIELPTRDTGRQRPEFVIGFAISPEEAHAKFKAWLADNGWYRPGDLRTSAVVDKMKGVYLPFWSFTMRADSNWQASIGEHWYRTETYTTTDSKGNTTTRTRQVQETEWYPLGGKHHRYYNGYLVSGSKGLRQDQALRVQPYQLPALKRYAPYFLAGWFAEEYSVDRQQALALSQQEFYRREQHNIAAFLPGDTHRNLQVSTNFSQVSSDLCLLPMYIASYKYQNKLYRFLLNGQTGRMAGDKPVSWQRIAILVSVIVAVVLVLLLIVALMSGRG
jgi:DNA-directed RNA polymerase subunit RPC12/RpoP